MKNTRTDNNPKRYSDKVKEKAFDYYCKGLNSKEIAKLLDINFRTVQQWQQAHKWKDKANPTGLTERIKKARTNGNTYPQIAKALNVSISTVYRHLKSK